MNGISGIGSVTIRSASRKSDQASSGTSKSDASAAGHLSAWRKRSILSGQFIDAICKYRLGPLRTPIVLFARWTANESIDKSLWRLLFYPPKAAETT
ncbi:MAG: hypothetical protein Aurels2KO_41440 [Aureliella sp.]